MPLLSNLQPQHDDHFQEQEPDKMVKLDYQSSDTERADEHVLRKHNRSSSSDQAKPQPVLSSYYVLKTVETHSTPTSPTRPKSTRPDTKRRKSSTSAGSKHKSSRPAYSRKYSTPPSRPLSPSGYPKMLEPDMVIPELNLNQANQLLSTPIYTNQFQNIPHQYHDLTVDTAPQEPDIWSDPETDYFSTIEGAGPRHARGKSRRQVSQTLNATNSLNAIMASGSSTPGLQQISEEKESEFAASGMPGGFA